MNTKLMSAMALAFAVAACADAPQYNAALENARSAVRSAEADPNVSKYAAIDLQSAQQELVEAETASSNHDEAAIAQPAYLAAKTARLAQLRASAKADDARVANGQVERDRIQLAARTHEAAAADRSRDQANMARDQATIARDQATIAREMADQKSAELQSEVDALKAKPTDRGLVLTLGDVLFDTGRAELSPGSSRNLDQLVQFLTQHPQRQVEIDGYTDSVGTDSYNLDLSQRRADSVESLLISRGIDPSRIVSKGYGKAYNVAGNDDSGGRQRNRRVEIVIGGDDGAAVAARGS